MNRIEFSLEDFLPMQDGLRAIREFARSPRRAVQGVTFAFDRLIRDTFQKQTDPWGTKWPELAPATLAARKRAKNFRVSKLVATAELFRSLKRYVDNDNMGRVEIGTPNRPVLPHLFGNPDNRAWGGPPAPIPARPMLPMRPGGVIDMPAPWTAVVMREIVKNLPKEVK